LFCRDRGFDCFVGADVELCPSACVDHLELAPGQEPDKFCPLDCTSRLQRLGGNDVVGVGDADVLGVDDVHAHLCAAGDVEGERPQAGATNPGSDRAGDVYVGGFEEQVVGDEHGSHTDAHRTGGWMWCVWSVVGQQRRPRGASHVGKRALGSVEEDRHVEFRRRPARKVIAGAKRVVAVGTLECDEGHHVDDAESRVHARVMRNVESLDRASGDVSHAVRPDGGEDAAIVVGVGMDVENRRIDGPRRATGNEPYEAGITAFAHVDHALEHPAMLSGRCRVSRRAGRFSVCSLFSKVPN